MSGSEPNDPMPGIQRSERASDAQFDTGSRMHRRPTTSVSDTLRDLRAKATELFLEQMAILVLANHPGRLPPDAVSANVDAFKSMRNRKELKVWVSDLRMAVEQMRLDFGVNISREQALALMAWIERNIQPNQACYLPAGMLAENLSIYAKLNLPPHARISVDPLCIGRHYPGGFETRLLEASLFEDMCALFNQSHEFFAAIPRSNPSGDTVRKIAAKRHAALMRATVSSAFYFVEAYVNCLATDRVYKKAGQLSEKERTLLTEWDSSKNRVRFVSNQCTTGLYSSFSYCYFRQQ